MIDWAAIECALFDWVNLSFDGSTNDVSLDTGQIVWKDQNIPQPVYPYIALKKNSVIRVGGKDEIRTSTDLTKPQGQEIALTTNGVREFTLGIEAFVDEQAGANKPNCDAMYMLSILQGSLSQQTTQETFCLAGLSVIEELAVVDLSEVVNGRFISRASMDVRFRTTFSCIERTGYIDTVRIKSVPCDPSGPNDVSGVDITVGT